MSPKRRQLETPVPAPSSAGNRRRAFRLAALLLPLVLLALTEGGLRWAGYGFSTRFFLRDQRNGAAVWRENLRFGWWFFPPAMARAPQPITLPMVKPPGSCRIFVLGESAAMGDPAPQFGLSRMLETLLQARFPSNHFEVVNAAMTAINSHAILPIARDCAARDGDVWLIYMGNNEVVGPFGAGTVFGLATPPLPVLRASLAFKSTRTGQALDALRRRFLGAPLESEHWGGMEMFLKQQVPQDDPRMDRVYGYFQSNLRAILAAGQRAGVKQIVCTVGVNLKDSPPFASRHGAGYAGSRQAEWDQFWTNGVTAEAASRFEEANTDFGRAAQIDPSFAELAYRQGRCLEALGRPAEALRAYEQARDLDTLRFRADSRLNQIITAQAKDSASKGIYFLDAASLLATNSPRGLPGHEFFHEHVHLNFEGNYTLARAAAEQIIPLLPASLSRAGATNGWLSPGQCAQRLAWDDWSRLRLDQDLFTRFQDPPFINQLGQAERSAQMRQEIERLTDAMKKGGLKTAALDYQVALSFSPDNWLLHDRFGAVLREMGDLPKAMEQWQAVLQLLPDQQETLNNLAYGYYNLKQFAEAERNFARAIALKPDFVEALNGLALTLSGEGKFKESADDFQLALARDPKSPGTHVNFAVTLESQGRIQEALAHYNEALRLDPSNGVVRLNLGKLAAGQNNLDEALRQFSEAVRLMPGNPQAHFSLGTVLLARKEYEGAARETGLAAALDPQSAETRLSLGAALLQLGRSQEAEAALRESIKMKPGVANAHLCLGMALAQQSKLTEAITEFRESLRLDPANDLAKRYLDQAQSDLGRGQ